MSSSNEKTYRSLELAVEIIQGIAEQPKVTPEQSAMLADIAEDLNDIIVYAQLIKE